MTRAEKANGAFRTIREVSDWLGVPTHVLRFWESKFDKVAPVKGSGGRRYYRPDDMRLLGGIKVLLHDQGQTIRGVARRMDDEGVDGIARLSPALDAKAPTAKPRRVLRPVEDAPSDPVPVQADGSEAPRIERAAPDGPVPPSRAMLNLLRDGVGGTDPRRLRRVVRRLRNLADEIEEDLSGDKDGSSSNGG